MSAIPAARHLTLMSEDAHAAATTDREATAALVVAMARRDALDLIVAGKPGEALYRLQRALLSASRILGASS